MAALDHSVTFLMKEISMLAREDFRRRAQHLGLTQTQWRLLFALSKSPGLKPGDLAERMEVHPVSITQIVDRLVKAGWVERQPHLTDRRAVTLHLTEKAHPLMDELCRIAEQTHQRAVAGLTPAQHKQLEQLLIQVKRNLSGADPEVASA